MPVLACVAANVPTEKVNMQFLKALLLNIASLAGFWVLGFALVKLAERSSSPALLAGAGQLIAAAVACAVSWRVGAIVSAYILGIAGAASAAELIMHSIYGPHTVQGAPTHFAVFAASIAGTAVGAYFYRVQHRHVVETRSA